MTSDDYRCLARYRTEDALRNLSLGMLDDAVLSLDAARNYIGRAQLEEKGEG